MARSVTAGHTRTPPHCSALLHCRSSWPLDASGLISKLSSGIFFFFFLACGMSQSPAKEYGQLSPTAWARPCLITQCRHICRGKARIWVSTTCRAFDDVEVCPESLSNPAGELQMLTLQVKYLNLSEGVYLNGSVFASAEHLLY